MDMLEQLRRAAILCDVELLRQLISEIRILQPAAANVLLVVPDDASSRIFWPFFATKGGQ